jgi:hypothetical protein
MHSASVRHSTVAPWPTPVKLPSWPVTYEIYRHRNRFGKPPGVIGRSEFGIEITVAIAYHVYCLGLSIDKACQVLSFFQQLKLRKSQADALLNQLATAWESEFDSLCTLLAHSAVVHTDETSWSINSVWASRRTQLFSDDPADAF